MSIHHCPDEVLDMVFELLPFQSPDKVPAALLPTMLTCSRFCAIAKRHLIRIVCLHTAEEVNAFAAYLTQLIDTGTYGKVLLPIEHMAVFGKYRVPQFWAWRPTSRRNASEAEEAAEDILPFVISTAAPSIRSLAIFGFDSRSTLERPGPSVNSVVKYRLCFPKLQRLILLEQHVIWLDGGSGECRYPQLTSLYTHTRNVDGIFALCTLREIRLDMLRVREALSPPSAPTHHVETIIIDAPPYQSSISSGGCIRTHQPRSTYDEKIENYRAFVKANSSSPQSAVVIAQDLRVHAETVLDGWKDTVQGGPGCWKKG
jgi:hypothetical protein